MPSKTEEARKTESAPVDPVVLPDVATEPHPSSETMPQPCTNPPPSEQEQQQDVLPQSDQTAPKKCDQNG
jgi:hypothetical protein